MAKFRSLKNSLIAGQISPTAMGRTDLPQYAGACAILQNMIPMVSGGAYRRPGSLFDHSFDANLYTYPRLIPFVVSQEEPYILALNRAFAGSGQITAYRPGSTVAPSTATAVSGTTPYAFDLSTLLEETDQIQYAQSVDVMTLVHPNHKPLRVRRTATDTFTVSEFDTDGSGNTLTGTAFMNAWPFNSQNSSAITMSINVATVGTGRILSASTSFFKPGHVGAVFKVNNAGTIGCAKVTGYTNSTTVTVSVIVAFGAPATPVTTWWESSWSDYRGWPRSVALFQQRICYGGNATYRDSVWHSYAGNFDVMSVAALQSPYVGDGVTTGATGFQPFTFTITSGQLNLIQWLSPGVTLGVGTLGQEFILTTTSQGFGSIGTDGYGANTAICASTSQYGSSYHPAVRVGSELICAAASADSIRSVVFNMLEDSYNEEPIQTLFDEYPWPNIGTRRRHYLNYAWDESRKTLWCLDTAGSLFGMTRDRTLKVTAWHTHKMGGYDSTENALGRCAGSVISVAVIPNPALKINDVWLTVIRHVNGSDYYHVERFMGKGIASDTVVSPALATSGNYFTDATVYDANGIALSVAEDHVSDGLYVSYSHLEGETVSGTADSERGIFTLRTAVVASGKVPLSTPYPPGYDTIAYNTAFGLPFDSIVKPVRVEAGSQIGTAQGAIKRIHKATIRVYRTLSAKIGASEDLLETIIFREGATPMGYSPELFTGDKMVDLEGDYDRYGYIYLLQDQPLPFAVMSIIAEGMTDDG